MAELTVGKKTMRIRTGIAGHEEIAGWTDPVNITSATSYTTTLYVRTGWTCSCGEKGELGTLREPNDSLSTHADAIGLSPRVASHG